MANLALDVASATITTTSTTMYTATGSGTIIGMNLCNTTAAVVTVSIYRNGVYIRKDMPIAVGVSEDLHKLNFVAGDTFTATCSAANGCDAYLSIVKEV